MVFTNDGFLLFRSEGYHLVNLKIKTLSDLCTNMKIVILLKDQTL